ncbi:MAG: hypothetical protein JWO36_3762 [Myxococcales bacterium]|nr:hypothetical protein [Myxococcales bacterium]
MRLTQPIALLLLLGCRDHRATSKEQRAADALAHVQEIELTVAKVRGLELQHAVPAEYQSAAEFRAYVHREVSTDPDARNKATALVALGLLPPSVDLARSVEDAYATQAAAYYDTKTKKFLVVMVPATELAFDMLSAHELTHGLQDQHFGLARYLDGKLDSDARTARRFVVEGDATLAMIMYAVFRKTKLRELSFAQIAALREQLEKMAALDTTAMAAMLKQQAAVSTIADPDLKKSIDAMDTIPRTILVPLLGSYMKGALVALTAYEHGGWPAVDDLYQHPPESTEQVLHPKERLILSRDRPHHVRLPTFDGYELVASDVIGELQWSVYFSLWKHEGDGHEEQNWGGDRYAVLRGKDGKLMTLIATIWDTEYDATVFYDAYLSTLRARYPEGSASSDDEGARGLGFDLVRDDHRVYIVDGGDQDVMDVLVDDTTFE